MRQTALRTSRRRGRRWAEPRKAGVVDQDVDGARLVAQAAQVDRVPDVGGDEPSVPARFLNLGDGLRAALLIAAVDDDIGPELGQRPRRRTTDARQSLLEPAAMRGPMLLRMAAGRRRKPVLSRRASARPARGAIGAKPRRTGRAGRGGGPRQLSGVGAPRTGSSRHRGGEILEARAALEARRNPGVHVIARGPLTPAASSTTTPSSWPAPVRPPARPGRTPAPRRRRALAADRRTRPPGVADRASSEKLHR